MSLSPLDGQHLLDRLDQLAAISESKTGLLRRFLTEEHRRANALVAGWMVAAGMSVRTDAIGNIIGRYEAAAPDAPLLEMPALMLGSHLDTVADAGRYDGMLGVVSAIAAVADLHLRGKRLPFAIEIIGFGDEEGVRFGATLLGSRAVAGTFDSTLLEKRDADGISMAAALARFGLDPTQISQATRRRSQILGYLELHIEQGPVLESAGLAVGCVTAISGATRFAVAVTGMAGHAGTVPMANRRDALAAAAVCILAIEAIARDQADVVATVGTIEARPGAVNVISGHTSLSLDLRAPADAQRAAAEALIRQKLAEIAQTRNVAINIVKTHESPAARCAPWLMEQIDHAITAKGSPILHLPSGAGHDGMAMVALTDIAMIFVRCKGGISHNPAEAITAADAETATKILLHVIEHFEPRG